MRDPFRRLIATLNGEFARRKVPLAGDPMRSILRIHRDVRFSPDKRPYKSNAAATLTRDVEEMSSGLLYIHLSPAESFVAAGFYAVDSAELTLLRHAIAEGQKGWLRLEKMLAKAGLAWVRPNPLKRLPRGFDPAETEPVAEALKQRSLLVKQDMTRQEMGSPALVSRIGSFARSALPLLEFGWKALD